MVHEYKQRTNFVNFDFAFSAYLEKGYNVMVVNARKLTIYLLSTGLLLVNFARTY